MFLHVGGGVSVPVKDIVMILGCEGGAPEGARKALETLKSVDAGGIRRSAVLTADTAYYSPIARGALCGRLKRVAY